MKSNKAHDVLILIAEDDADDRYLTKAAFEENASRCEIDFVEDGDEVFDFLYSRGKFATSKSKMPSLIMLDLNMPKKDGRQVLDEIKKAPSLKHIPIIIFTTSKSPEDVRQVYSMGASSFITKPTSFEGLQEVARNIEAYWVKTATLI
ncbi:MAG: response regulator [Saprospiraceae bacterium]